jgi:hypothetical protein
MTVGTHGLDEIKTKRGQPMSEVPSQTPERELDSGDRIHIRQGQRPISHLVGQSGTIVEVFRAPRGSCLVRIDNDPNRQREWFFYRDEVAPSAV